MYGSPSLARLAPLTLLLAAGFILPYLLPQYFLFLGNVLMMYAVLALGLDILLGWAYTLVAVWIVSSVANSALLRKRPVTDR